MKFTKSKDGLWRTNIHIKQRIGLLEMVVACALYNVRHEPSRSEVVGITREQLARYGSSEDFWPFVEGRELGEYRLAMSRVLKVFPELKCNKELAMNRIASLLEGR